MKSTISLLLFLLLSTPVFSSWQYTVSHYHKKEYNAGNQNWRITQHPNGWIYIANNKGLLEFDGVYWNTYPFEYTKMRAVKIGSDHLVYAGGLEEFGYYTPNARGELEYTSLSKQLSGSMKIGVIWEIAIGVESVFFISNNTVFQWKEGNLSVLYESQSIIASAMIENKFHLLTQQGIMVLDDHELRLLPNSESLGKLRVMEMLPTERGILLISNKDGLYFYKDGNITQYTDTAQEFIQNNHFFCAAIKDTQLALGTVQNGILLLNLKNNEWEHISIENGLQNKTVLRLYFDCENNLWVGLDNGIDCIHLDSPILSLCKSKIIGSGYSAAFKKNYLYLGTNQGLYTAAIERLNKEKNLEIKLIQGMEGQIWSVRDIENDLFCNSDNGVFLLNDGQAQKIAGTSATWNVMSLNANKDILIGGTYSGLFILKRVNGQWLFSHRIAGFSESSKTMITENLNNNIWIANSEHGVYRLKISEDLKEVEHCKNYNTELYPVRGNICIASIDNDLVFTSVCGLFRYNQIKDKLEEYQELEELLDGKAHYTYLKQDTNRNIWYVANGTLKLIRYNAHEKAYERNKYDSYLPNALIEDFEDIYFYSDHQILIGTEDGFSFINTQTQPSVKRALSVQIRRVFNTTYLDSLIYGRSFTENTNQVSLPYSHNSLRIEYSANRKVLYSWKLSGGDANEEWSEYTKQASKDLTNLREGNYTFEVRAMANDDVTPAVASLQFKIHPPWYRSVYAYVLYVFLFVLLVCYIWHRIQESRKLLILQKKKEMLQQELEFKLQNEMKDKKIDSLREENLKAELKHKTAELINSTLNITRKNEILLDIKKEAISMGSVINEGNLVNIRRKNLQLINKINTNLEHDKDLKNFETNFDALHHDFFSVLSKYCPGLSRKEKMLCAYVRMNMISKEIAPLLNMSVRGVEITRYRLRKKLNLGEKDNLHEFLQRITVE